jgi:hypothetical protein
LYRPAHTAGDGRFTGGGYSLSIPTSCFGTTSPGTPGATPSKLRVSGAAITIDDNEAGWLDTTSYTEIIFAS